MFFNISRLSPLLSFSISLTKDQRPCISLSLYSVGSYCLVLLVASSAVGSLVDWRVPVQIEKASSRQLKRKKTTKDTAQRGWCEPKENAQPTDSSRTTGLMTPPPPYPLSSRERKTRKRIQWCRPGFLSCLLACLSVALMYFSRLS